MLHDIEHILCGSYLGSTAPLSYGSSCSIGINFCGGTPPVAYEAAEDVDTRMDSNKYDSRILYDAGIAGLMFALAADDVVFFAGHGDYSGYYLGVGTYLVTGAGYFGVTSYPPIIASKLFFACACGSGLGGYFLCLPDVAITLGCGCYFGRTTRVTADYVLPFVEYFFDKVVNGVEFDQCAEYAKTKTAISGSLFELWGDENLHIQAYDRGPGFSYADQKYDHEAGSFRWSASAEPLWGGDIDAFRHVVESSGWTVELTVIPSSDMKVKVVVYYWHNFYWRWYLQGASSVPGEGVYRTWTEASRDYLVVISHNDDHGGYYDYELRVIAS